MQSHLDEIARELIGKGIRTNTFIGHGDAASEIVRIAEQQRVGLIVIATFGKNGMVSICLRLRDGKGSAPGSLSRAND